MQEEEVSERQPLPLGADTAGQPEESINPDVSAQAVAPDPSDQLATDTKPTDQVATAKSGGPGTKDNKLLAIIAMNISATGATGVSATYRIIAAEGFHPGDFNLFRNLVALTVAIFWSSCSRVHPIKDFPKGKRWPVFGRMFFG